MENTRKKILRITNTVLVLAILAIVTLVNIFAEHKAKTVSVKDNETRRAMTYNEITDADADIDNCEYVKFSSFFIRDLDGDGYAERYNGTCNHLDKKATLYFDINVLTDGRLENGKITINGKNFNLQTTLIKDSVLKQDYIGTNVTSLELNTINYGTQKLFSGTISADIGSNINNYSITNNQVILTGTWISTDGTKTAEINKVIPLQVDWYGKTATFPYTYNTYSYNIEDAVGDDVITLDFNVGYEEAARELLIQKQVTEITIPDLNGYAATDAIATSQNCTYNYDSETKILTITRQAATNANGTLTKTVSRYNNYGIRVTYPKEAQAESETNTISIAFPTTGYYYGYNNSSDEFANENPYVSSASRTFTHTWSEPVGDTSNPSVRVDVGRNVYNPDTSSYRHVVSKKLPINMYNNIENNGEKDEYTVTWSAYTGELSISSFSIEETQGDKFLKSDGTYIDMTDYIKPTGIYFSNMENAIEDKYSYILITEYDSSNNAIRSYNSDGSLNEGTEIHIDELKEYTKENPFKLNSETKKVSVSAIRLNKNQSFYINQIKEIDDEKLINDFSYEDFSNLNYIYSYVTGTVSTASSESLDTNEKPIQGYSGDTPDGTHSDTDYAYYEAPVSSMKFTVTPTAITNQETKNIKMNLTPSTTYYNEEKWTNGVFVVELPPEILGVEINNITIDNTNVKISSYETYEENGKQYIKIYTNNDTAETYNITIDADITADPRKPTLTNTIKLYAINQNCNNYRTTSRTPDVLDINGNGNVSENVLYKTASMQLVAPTSLLTSQTLSNFDDAGTEVVSPQIAILDKIGNTREAQVNQTLTNNYSGTISEVKVIGKIPFKGNTYQINGKDLGSTYSAIMKQDGITLPDSVKDIAKVYYSTNETVNSTVTDATNNWKTADEVTDWSSIKTYLIDLSSYTIAMKENLVFSYKIEIPANVTYNDIAYTTHAVEFCLDTEDGKLRSKTEVNRLGIMIAKKYTINLTKYKVGTDKKVQGATYKITDGTTARTGITDENGNITISNLFVDKEYTLSEIQTPGAYVLNEDEIKFKVTVDNSGNPQVNIISGTPRDTATVTNNDGVFTLNLNVEDVAKYDLKINKTNTQNEKLKGVKFKLTGGIYGQNGRTFTTNSNGEILISNIVPDTEYTLQETKADGYYINQNTITFKASRNASNQLTITSNDSSFKSATVSEEAGIDKATVSVNIQNESIPKYTLVINKENKNGDKLEGTQFKLKSLDTDEETYYTTDANGAITISDLYQYVDGKYVTGEYILQEVLATSGYVTDPTEIKFKAEQKDGQMNITILSGEDAVKSTEAGTDTITFTIENNEIFKLIKKEGSIILLPNAVFKITDLDGNPAKDVNGNLIGELIGEPAEKINFQTSQTNPWTLRTDGTWESGGKAVNNATSTLTSDNFTLSKDGKLTFDWAASSESANYDYLYYTITNINTKETIGGTSTKIGGYTSSDTYETLNFTTQEIDLTAGTYNIVFTYKKDNSGNNGLDAGFVRNVQIAGNGYYGLRTDGNGEITASLPEGLYKVIETEAPEGYVLPENEEDRTYYVGIGASRPQESEFTVKAAKQITGSGASNIYDVEPTDDGGYIAVGSFFGEIDVDGDGTIDLTSEGGYDQLVVKYDKDSKVEWCKVPKHDWDAPRTQDDELYSVSILPDGNYLVSGYETYTELGSGEKAAGGVAETTMEDAVFVELDTSGDLVGNNYYYVDSDYKDEMKDAIALSNGDIIAIGRFSGPSIDIYNSRTDNTETITNQGTNNAFIICYSTDDSWPGIKWIKSLTGTGDINPTSITETSQGIAISVDYVGTVTLQDGDTFTSKGNQDSMIIGMSLDGTAQWYQNIGGTNDESIVKLATDEEDNVVAVGGFASSLTLGSETITPPTTSYSNSIMAKFSSIDGTYISSKTFGGTDNDDKISSVTATKDGGLLLGAWYYSKDIDIDGDGTADITSVAGANDSVIIKLNSENEVEWYRTITGNSYDAVYAVTQLKDNDFIAAGDFDSTTVSISDYSEKMNSQGYTDGFIYRIGDLITAPEVPEVQELEVTNEIKKLKITTEVGENSEGERTGGTITGTKTTGDILFVEEVRYGSRPQTQIVITPDTDYSISSIEINGEPYTAFTPDSNGKVTFLTHLNYGIIKKDYHIKVVFEKNFSKVTVHHYIKDKNGNYTTDQVADDEYISGKVGSNYETSPKTDIDSYDLEKDLAGNYVVPTNAKGTFSDTETEVTYYYEEVPYTLTVHHYLDGTEEKLAEDEISKVYYGETYSTSPNSEVLKKYNLVYDEPIKIEKKSDIKEDISWAVLSSGGPSPDAITCDVEIIYYYTAKQYTITTEVKTHDETDFAGNTIAVKGGSISGEEQTPYETVTINENSQKDITITADANYQIKAITIESTDEDGNKTTEQVPITGSTRTYTLDKFDNMTSNKHVIVEYEKVTGTVTVHHYIEGTTDKVPLLDGGTADDESRSGLYGETYATKPRTDIPEKYELVAIPDNASGTFIDGNIEVIYYYREVKTTVTVHHYLEGTTTKLTEDVIFDGVVGDNYTTGVGNVENKYELVAIPANANGKMTKTPIEVIYYYRLKNTSVLVHHYIEGTTTSLSKDVTINGKVDDAYNTTQATDIPSKYELVAEPANKAGTMTVEQTIVTYYYRLKETGVDVHYYKEGTTQKVAEDTTITGRVDDKYETKPATNVPSKYELVQAPSNASGTMTETRITVIYYYRLKDTSVLVHHYLEGTTTKLADDEIINGKVDDTYKTVESTELLAGKYTLVAEPVNKTGTMTEAQIVVTYYYRKKDTSVLVHHYIKDSSIPLSTDVTINGRIDDSYTTTQATDIPEQYELVAEPANKAGTMTEDPIVVTYYYQLKSYPYTVNYLEKDTNEILHEPKQGAELVYGSKVNTADEKMNIDGYNYDSADKDVLTIGITNNVINIYYTKRTDLSYTVNYLEKGTNAVLQTPKTQENMTFNDEVLSAGEVIKIDGYNYDSADKVSIKITTGTNVINLYYTKRADLAYTVNYLEKGTNNVLLAPKTVNNMTFGDVIVSNTEEIDIDGYNYDSADKNSIKITTGANVINLYYTKRNDLSYTVNYLEKGTNKVLNEPKTQDNMTFGTTITSISEKIDINGYNYDSADNASITITTGTNVINLYYTKRTDLSYTVNYLEKTTNKVLHEPKVVENRTFEEKITSSTEKIDINGYNFDSYDKETLTIGTGNNVINIYYTKRTDLSYKVKYLEKTTNKVLHDQKEVENRTFEETITSSTEKIDINGYNFDSYDKETLTIGTGENVINIYYTKRNDLSYTVNYLESVTNNVLHEPKTQGNMTFEDVVKAEDEAIKIDGYSYDYPDKYELVIGTSDNVLNIYYTKVTGLSYTVNYLEKDTNNVLFPANTISNMTFGDTVESSKEVINIDGYNYNSVDKDTLTIGTSDNIINIYYTKRTDLEYKVNYLEKGTNKVLNNQKIQTGMTFQSTVDSSKEVIQINGYNNDSVDKATLTIGTGDNVINIYYTKRTDLSYTVNYLEKTTNKVLHNQKVQDGMTFETVINSVDEKIDIDGYNYDSVDKATLTIGTGDNIINIYYTKKTDLSYTVNYLEKTTNKVLHEQKVQNGMTFESVVNSADEKIDIDGYNFDSYDKETLTIGTGNNVINIYYTKRTDLSYKVNYLEKGTNKVLHDQKVVENKTFEDTITSATEIIEIDGYNYDSVDKDTLSITTGDNVINIYYTKRTNLSYTVNYLEKDTNKVLSAPKTTPGMTFETVITSKNEVIPINGYKYDSVDKETLTITTGENIINIYYTKVTGLSYTVNYLEKDTNEVIHPAKTEENQVFENEITSLDEAIEIDGYNFDSVDKDTLTIGTGENIINIYYTKRNDLEYKVNYLEKDTNKVLHEQKTQTGMTFKDTVTSANEVIDINGYDYDSVDKDVLTIGTGENVINIYYIKRADLSYTVNYLEKGSNKVLSAQRVVDNVKFESVVTAADEVIEIDGYNYDSVDKATLTIQAGENIINIYYTKRNDLSYTVNYLEKTTNKVLHEQKVQNGMTFESVINSVDEKIDIDGYNYDSVDKDTLTIRTGDNVINIYYTKRNNLSYKVNYLEKTTNKVLHDQKTQNGMTFEDTVDSSKEVIAIDGYNYDSVDKATLSITTGENVINVYYTKRTDLSYTVNYLEKDTNKVLNEPKTQNGMTFETVVDSSKEVIPINGYKYDSVDKDTLTITTGTNVINIYYTKVTGLSYTVNYLEKDTNIVINPAKIADGVTFEDEIKSVDEIIAIDGYNFNSVDKDILTIGTGENVINIYYTKRTDLSYKVNYLEKGTNKVLNNQIVVENMTFDAEITSSNEVIEIDGYNYDSVDKASIKITTGENVINIYYTKRTDLSYKVNYLEKDTNKVLSNQKVVENMTFESTITSADEVIDIDGYNYDSVDKETLTIQAGENVINVYYTKRTDLSYKVNYLEKTTNKVLHEQKVVENMTFESIVTSANEVIDIDGYNYDSVDKDTLSITTGENIINIYYTKRNDLSYTVNYLEKNTNKVLSEAKVVENVTFETVITSANEVITIDGYNYDSVDKDTLTISTGENVINIYYTKRNDLSYTVNYLEKGTNKAIYAPKVTGNMTFEDEITSANEIIQINGYSYDSVDKDKLIITTGANVINIYYTKVQGLAYTVNYLEKDTDKVIHEPKTTDNMTFEEEITSADEVIEIDGYNYDSVDKDTLVIGTDANVINIYYTKRTDLSYKVNYLEKDTNKVLHDQKVVENMTFESTVTSADEVISIDGYNYDSVDKETLTITTGENIINIYYTKRNDLSYTVNYLEKDTNNVIHDQKVVENMTYESVINSADEVITIYGYNYDSIDKDTLTISTSENVINIYYTKKDAKVTVHYYEENTTNKVSEDKEITGKVNDEYTTVIADDIPSKYELVATPDNANGTMTEDEITVIYYFRKKATQVIVRHYEEGTTNKLSQDVVINGRVDDTYTTTPATDIPIKYELSITPANANGNMAETTIEVIYYYRVKDAVVNVRYLEKNTNIELAPADKLDGKVDDPYTVGAKTIDGYTMVEHSGNESGKFEVDPITITYYYLYNTRATVQYIDKTTGKILEESTQEGLEGDEFATESKDFTNYILVEEAPQKTVKMTKDEIVLKYYYIHISGGVIEKHIDVISGEILANDTHNGNEGDPYDIKSRTFTGYDLVEERLPSNAQGTMKVDPIEVIYYYIYRTKVTAKYIDRATGSNLTPDVVQDGHEGDAYVTERKTFDDYKLVEVPVNADGAMTKDDITVTYYYVHTSGGVIINHLDVNTNKQLKDEAKIEGYEGDPYETHEENIPGYTLVQDKYPANANGTMTIDPTRVTYYYVKNTEVNIKYIDKETGEEIAEKTNIPGNEGDNFTTEPKDVPGYDLVEEPEQKDGTMTAEPIELIYYYRRPAKVIAKYFDNETKEEIATEEKQDGHQNDEYTTEAKDIKYYKLLETPSNANGTMTVTVTKDENGNDIVEDTTYVNYYYRKLDFNLSIDKKVASVTVNGNETTINGDLAKIEVYRKDFSTAKVEVKYTIKVTNNGELSGKASILEDIPTGMTMSADKNSGWDIKGTTATRETKDLQPGESEEYVVTLDWENGANNVGMKENTASIISTENEAGYAEKDTSDNEDKADIIVAISTGGHTYIIAAGAILLVLISLAGTVYVIRKRK